MHSQVQGGWSSSPCDGGRKLNPAFQISLKKLTPAPPCPPHPPQLSCSPLLPYSGHSGHLQTNLISP